MREKLPSRDLALQILRYNECQAHVIEHCIAVAGLAVEIANICEKKGIDVDLKLVEIGALLHDLGRAKTHSVHHAVVGAEIAKKFGLPKSVISIINRHVGGGITASEAKKLGWPEDIYVPQRLEEKIVSFADKLVEGGKRVPIERTVENLSKNLPPIAIARIQRLNREMQTLINNSSM